MDFYFAAVELLDRPDLKNRPVAVGGRPEGRGVITTCNYIARKFGVGSALSSREAVRRCPDLIILPSRFAKYKEISEKIRKIFKRYSPSIETVSLDEAYIDVSQSVHFAGRATLIAQAIRKDIFNELGLTASAGIAPNKFLAKVASDWKKPNGQLTIAPHQVSDFVIKLEVKKIPGVGKVTQARLAKLNLKTCEDLQKFTLAEMENLFGSFGVRLYDLCRGIDHSKVKTSRARKSISVETTLNKDVNVWGDVEIQVKKLFLELEFRIDKNKIRRTKLKSIGVKFKSDKFEIHTRERLLEFSLDNFLEISKDHFLECNFPVRLIGLSVKLESVTRKKNDTQVSLF